MRYFFPFILLFFPLILKSQWYDPDWLSRCPVIVDNSVNPDTLVDFQVDIIIPFLPGMQPDFDDIRFTIADYVTSIPYWIEEYIDSNYALVWVNVPLIPELDTTILYLYYENPNATSESNGNAVFEYFDDFNDQDISDWTILSGSWTANNQFLEQMDSQNWTKILSPYILTDMAITESKMNYLSSELYAGVHIFLSDDSFGVNGYIFGYGGLNGGGTWIAEIVGSSVYRLVSDSTIYNGNYPYTWLKAKITYDGIGNYSFLLKAPDSVQVYLSVNHSAFTHPFYLGALVGTHIGIDDLRVRKFTDPEPITSIGEVQTQDSILIEPNYYDSTGTGQIKIYSIQVKNQGTSEDIVEITKVWTESAWNVIVRDSLTGDTIIDHNNNGIPDIDTLHAGEARSLLVDILTDDSCFAGTTDTTIIKAYFSSDSTVSDTCFCITKILTTVLLSIEPDQSESIYAGDSIYYYLNITNWGNIKDVVDVASNQSMISWSCDLFDSTGLPLIDHNGNMLVDIDSLYPFGTPCRISVRIQSSILANPGDVDTTRILVSFTGYPSLIDTATLITTILAPLDNIIIEPDQFDSTFTGQIKTYSIQVENIGQTNDIVEIIKQWTEPSWSIWIRDAMTGDTLVDHNGNGIPDLDTVYSNETRYMFVDVLPTDSSYAGVTDTAIINAYFSSDSTISDYCTIITKIITDISLTIEPNQSGSIFPGEGIEYSLDITNNGNIKDVVDVTAIQNTPLWSYGLLDSSGIALIDHNGNWIVDIDTLNPFGTTCGIVSRINSPGSANPGDVDSTYILVRFTGYPSSTDTATLITSILSPGSTLVLIDPDQSGYIDAGSTLFYDLTVRNLGSIGDVIDIEYTGTHSGWTCSLLDSTGNPLIDTDGDGTVDVGNVPSMGSVSMEAGITAPTSAFAGETDSTILWATSSIDTTVKDNARLVTTVNTSVSVLIEPDCSDSALPQDTVIYTLTVTNLGNSPDIIDITFTGGNVDWYFSLVDINGLPLQDTDGDTRPDVGVVPVNGSVIIRAHVSSPDSAMSGDTDSRIVYATSSNNENIYDTATITTNITGSVTLFIVEPNYTEQLEYGMERNYSLWVVLDGTAQDYVEIYPVGTSNGWSYEIFDSQFNPLYDSNNNGMFDIGWMQPGDTIRLNVTVQAPYSMTGVDSLGLRITVTGETERYNMQDSAVIYSYIVPILDIHNYESPFTYRTTFRFSIPAAGDVYLDVYNRLGERVRVLLSGQHYQRGIYILQWNGRNESGNPLAPAVYYYVFRLIRNTSDERKIIKKTAIVR